jgi:hypothetical protein
MSSKPPPIPPEQRPKNAPDVAAKKGASDTGEAGQVENPDKRGQTANTKINTTHQGYQQDR